MEELFAWLDAHAQTLRDMAKDSVPALLKPLIDALPIWALALIVAFSAIGLAFGAWKLARAGWLRAFNRRKFEAERPATKGDTASLEQQLAAMLEKLDRLQAGQVAAGGAPLDAQARARRDDAVAGIVAEQTPASAAAAQAIADGRLQDAKRILEKDAAGDMAAAAEKWRRIGALFFGLDTAEALRAYEKAFALEPEDFWTAIYLARLRKEAGNLAGARQAALAAQSAARGDREISVAANDLGDLLVKAGDLNEAKARFGASLAIAERLARDNPGSSEAQRDVSVSLNKLGDVAVEAGDVNEAKARFVASLAIAERLARDDPGSAEAQRDVSVSLDRLGDVAVKAGDVNEAKARFGASLAIRERLARDNPGSAEAQRDVSVSLDRLGDVAVKAGDVNEAKARFGASLAILERLARDNPGSAEAQRDLSVSLDRLGDVAVQAGDVNEAKARFVASLAIRERLARDNPGSAQAQRDVGVSLVKLANIPGSGVHWGRVAAHFDGMQKRGVLAPSDQKLLEAIRAKAAADR